MIARTPRSPVGYTLDRDANAQTYPDGHPMYAVSAYDDFVIRILRDEDDEFWLYIEPRSGRILAIEGLSDVPDLIDVEGDADRHGGSNCGALGRSDRAVVD